MTNNYSNFIQLGREDIVALLTFPIAMLFFACAVIWDDNVNRVSYKPLFEKLQQLEKLKKEAEELNYSKTILLHGKKMREITKLEETIAEMRRRRGAFRRKVILTFVFYLIQCFGLLVVYVICRKFGLINRLSLFGYDSSSSGDFGGDEIVMVPHSFTSYWISKPKSERDLPIRYAIPFLSKLRSFGVIAWYIMCLVTCRVIYEGLGLKSVLSSTGNANNKNLIGAAADKKNE